MARTTNKVARMETPEEKVQRWYDTQTAPTTLERALILDQWEAGMVGHVSAFGSNNERWTFRDFGIDRDGHFVISWTDGNIVIG